MTAPQWEPTDQADLLALVADPDRPTGRDAVAAFLAACEADAKAHDGRVSVNRVSAALESEGIEHHRYSALWSHYTGRGKPMVKIPGEWEVRQGSKTGNNGKPMAVRRWVDTSAPELCLPCRVGGHDRCYGSVWSAMTNFPATCECKEHAA